MIQKSSSMRSITKIVHIRNKKLYIIGVGSIPYYWLYKHCPKKDYQVTYTADKKGKYKVDENYSMICEINKKPFPHGWTYIDVCWLPLSIHGYRVIRKVKILKRRRGNDAARI